MDAAILIIGNEVLSGRVRDENSPFLVDELRGLGVRLGRIITVPDDIPVIASVVSELSGQFDHVITCGGVGPTLDDVTFAGLAKGFGVPLTLEPTLERVVKEHLGDKVTDAHLRMATVPEGAQLVWATGTSWPTILVRNVLVLPGSPELVKEKWALVRERFRTDPFIVRRVLLCTDEAVIADSLEAVDEAFPSVNLGSYPVFEPEDHETLVTFESKDQEAVSGAVESFVSRLDPAVVVRIERG